MDFQLMWETNNVLRKIKTTITTFDYSVSTGFIAVGGVEGKLLLFDPSAKILISHAQAHKCDIMSIFFYDKQL